MNNDALTTLNLRRSCDLEDGSHNEIVILYIQNCNEKLENNHMLMGSLASEEGSLTDRDWASLAYSASLSFLSVLFRRRRIASMCDFK